MNEFVFFEAGRCGALCLPQSPAATAETSAQELRRYTASMTGTDPEVRRGAPVCGDIAVGFYLDKKNEDTLKLEVREGILWVDGGKRGVLYAAYELLEHWGCRFFTAECEKVPAMDRLALPQDFKTEQTPVFEYRNTFWHSVTSATAPKLRLNAILDQTIPEELGGDLHYNGFVHTLGTLAEMTPDEQGEFTDLQPCLTDEAVFHKVVGNLRRNLQQDPTAFIASVSQNDSHAEGRGCSCAACRALDDAEGTPMGSLLTFVNRVADELKEDHPALAIDTLAYRYTRKAPATLKARDNVIIRLCSLECCFSHPMEECDKAMYAVEDEGFVATLKHWANHSDRIYIWDYTTDYRNYNTCFPNFGVLRRNLRMFAQNHVKGVFEQGNNQSINGEFGELRAYVISKLLWNPLMTEEEYQRHINEFMEGCYGTGWKNIRRFFDRLHQAGQKVHFGIYYEDPTELFVDEDCAGDRLAQAEAFLNKGRADFAAARAQATAAQRTRLEKCEIQLDVYAWYLCRARLKALEDCGDASACEAARQALVGAGEVLLAHVLAHGITYMHESFGSKDYHFAHPQPDLTLAPAFWGK